MFYDRLQKICNELNVKITKVVEDSGGTKGQMSGWKKGSTPNIDIVIKIADTLNISVDKLLGHSVSAQKYLDCSMLNDTGFKKAQEYLKDLTDNPKYTKNTAISQSMSNTINTVNNFTIPTKQK